MIIYQSRIYRADLRANPDVLYIFGDNAERVGMGGQAGEMRGEPNAHGIATKKSCGAYFSDQEYDDNCATIRADMQRLIDWVSAGKTAVFPIDGIGTGLSDLPKQAPETWAYLVRRLQRLGIAPVQS